MSKKHEIRDGYFIDLPAALQTTLMKAHKRIKDEVDALLHEEEFEKLNKCQWSMNSLANFCAAPENEGDVGQARAYKTGEKYELMIQIAGHFTNHQNTESECLVHKLIDKVYKKLKNEFQKDLGLRLDSEGADGEYYEGFDVYPSDEVAKQVWELFEDKTTKGYKEHYVQVSQNVIDYYEFYCRMPFDQYLEERAKGGCTKTVAGKAEVKINSKEYDLKDFKKRPDDECEEITEAADGNQKLGEQDTKAKMAALTKQIMSDQKKGKGPSQEVMNIFASTITDRVLKGWASGWQKLVIKLDSRQSSKTVEFKVPNMTEDFVARFVDGRESINGFLHRNPEITIKVSAKIFDGLKSADDPYNFFRAAIKYYDSAVDRFSAQLMAEVRKLGPDMKKLISTTKLMGIVTYPLSVLFVFEDVDISNPKTFDISKDDIKTINTFVKNIATAYKDPEKEKNQIITDVKAMVKSLHNAVGINESNSHLQYLPEYLRDLFGGKFNRSLESYHAEFERAQVNRDWSLNAPTVEIKYLQEKFGVRKLKKIPRDLVAYITIEAESIKDTNDKMMIASYCLGKIEIVEWYIELLDVGSEKYIVPHNKPYLESLRTQLLACYKKIMDTKIPQPGTRPIIDIQYPKGYEG